MKAREFIQQALLLVAGLVLAAAAGRFGVQLYQAQHSYVLAGSFHEHVDGLPAPVTLYGTADCSYCKAAREYLKSARIPFNDIDIDEDSAPARRYGKLGLNKVPVLVSASRLVEGFRPDDFDKVLVGVAARSLASQTGLAD